MATTAISIALNVVKYYPEVADAAAKVRPLHRSVWGKFLTLIQTLDTDLNKVVRKETGNEGGRPNYTRPLDPVPTWFHGEHGKGDVYTTVARDIYFVKTKDTGSGTVEVHLLSSRHGFNTEPHHKVTCYGLSGTVGSFCIDKVNANPVPTHRITPGMYM